MATRETLETALLSSWDRDTLAVYADHLQAEGDPRGELIALDLQIAATGNTAELSKRRTSLLFAWLGALVPVDDVHAPWIGDSLQLGFVEHLRFDGLRANAVARLEQALASPAGPYVRALSMIGTAQDLDEAFAVLARYEHRWLASLVLEAFADAPVSAASAAAAFRAMPNLATLTVKRPATLGACSHPTIKRLCLAWRDTYVELGDGAVFEAVEELELSLRGDYPPAYPDEEEAAAPEPKLPEIAFPALRRLALDGTFPEALAFLRGFSARTRVRVLRIRDLPSAAARDDLAAAIRDMEALETIEIARGSYYQPQPLPRIAIVGGTPWPWPMQEVAAGQGLRVFMPGAKYGDVVAVLDAVLALEEHYEHLPLAARGAWDELWRALPATGVVTFAAGVLAGAVEAIPSLMEHGWRELREELSSRRPLAADAMVRIERCLVD